MGYTGIGHDYVLYWDPELKEGGSKKKKRHRKVTWFNPPFCRSVKSNLGKQFLRIVTEVFTSSHPLRKIFNKDSVKLSYSCLPNMGTKILANTNRKFLGKMETNLVDCIGHRRGATCPEQDGKCNRRDNVGKSSTRTLLS